MSSHGFSFWSKYVGALLGFQHVSTTFLTENLCAAPPWDIPLGVDIVLMIFDAKKAPGDTGDENSRAFRWLCALKRGHFRSTKGRRMCGWWRASGILVDD